MIVSLMMLLVALSLSAQAATNVGTTVGLINSGQLVRDASSAVPTFGFSMNATGAGEALDFIMVSFSGAGFTAGNDNDLRALDVQSALSGVGLYRDNGSVDDVLDPQDAPVTLDSIMWVGNNVEMNLNGHSEPVPLNVTGSYQWLIVIRTSEVPGTLTDGDQIVARINAGAIVATSGAGFVAQPAAPVIANALTVSLVKTTDMLLGTDRWIGPASATINSMAVLGLSIVDGGIATNHGISDRIQSLILTLSETGGAVSSVDFKPLSTNASTSGIAFYWDSGVTDDAWDASDAPINLASISPIGFGPGGVTFNVVFRSPGLDVPNAGTGNLDLFVVVRTAGISTGDSFTLVINPNDIIVRGLLGSQAGTVDSSLTTPMLLVSTVVPSSNVMGDATPPLLRNLQWVENSPNLAALNRDLYFNHLMTSTQYGNVTGQARDDESGLARVTFSSEPSLASSPGDMVLAGSNVWRSWAGSYGFTNVSTDASSPAIVTAVDRVGNQITTAVLGMDFYYHYIATPMLMTPNPGWIIPGGVSAWIDSQGKLWFSNLIYGTVVATVQVDIVSLFGNGLANASASIEPSLAWGPNPGFVAYGPGTDTATFATDYGISAGSSATSSPVTIVAHDNSGKTVMANFSYGLDTQGPSISFLSPSQGAQLSGKFIVRVTAADLQTAVETVEVEIDPFGGFQAMYFDGTSYFYPISSALYPDGNHRVIVRAVDMVGNENVVGVDVVFHNSHVDTVPPEAAFVAPIERATVSGTTLVQVAATDDTGVAKVNLYIGAAPPVAMSLNVTRGYYEYEWNTASLPDGKCELSATAIDGVGNKGSTLRIEVAIDNTAPFASMAAPIPDSKTNGITIFRVFASDTAGVKDVRLEVFGSTVVMAYNQMTGYYECSMDTRSIPDGNYSARAIVRDQAGHTTVTPSVSFRVQNGDSVRAFLDLVPLLLLIFLVLEFVVVLVLGRRGTIAKWLRREGSAKAEDSKAKEPPSKPQ